MLRADKGHATVMMNTIEYNQKMEKLLDIDIYRIKKKDLTPGIERRTTQLIKTTDWSLEVMREIQPTETHSPRLYLRLIKVEYH